MSGTPPSVEEVLLHPVSDASAWVCLLRICVGQLMIPT